MNVNGLVQCVFSLTKYLHAFHILMCQINEQAVCLNNVLNELIS